MMSLYLGLLSACEGRVRVRHGGGGGGEARARVRVRVHNKAGCGRIYIALPARTPPSPPRVESKRTERVVQAGIVR